MNNDPPSVRRARGAARTAIGKLIGDDAEVRAGRREQQAAEPTAQAGNRKE